MKLKLYNTLTRKTETFTPFNPAEVKIYTCGPTVYDQPHIGNYAAYVYWDLLVRTLRANGYGVKRVLNLTDVGHLTSDADDGEDKLEKGARRSHKTVWEVADYYIGKFLEDYHKLNLSEPEMLARATDYIAEDIALVDLLTAKGYTYETRDGIYFDTSKFPSYADFARLDLDNLKAGARVTFSPEKRNVTDFAVWKFIQPGEDHAMRWDYLGRPGYPGWHLECSTIIHTELGETIDIHTGGVDHIPVHHTNEIAQSETAFEKKLAKYWIHCNFLTIDKQKISKSLGNIWTIQDLADKGYSPMDFKMWVLQGHYQSEHDFNFDNLEAARVRRLDWRRKIGRLRYHLDDAATPGVLPSPTVDPQETWAQILAAVSDNLNSPMAFAAIDSNPALDLATWQKIDQLFGLNLFEDTPNLTAAQSILLEERYLAKLHKDYKTADELRDQLAAQNIAALDTKNGYSWTYLR